MDNNHITYSGMLPGVKMRLTYHANRLKEELIISQAARNRLPDPRQFGMNPDSVYVAFLSEIYLDRRLRAYVDNAEAPLENFHRKKRLTLKALGSRARFLLPLDFAYLNTAGADSANGQYIRQWLKRRIIRRNGKLFVVSGVPYSWIVSLPPGEVVIDPTVVTSEATEDTWIENSSTHGSDSRLIVGKQSNYPKKRSVLKFPVEEIPPYANITRAELKIYYHGVGGSSANFIDRWVRVSAVYTPWSEATATAYTPWSATLGSFGSGPGSGADFETDYADQVLYIATRPLWKTFNLQCVVDDWITSAYTNNGVVLWADNEYIGATDLRMRSSE